MFTIYWTYSLEDEFWNGVFQGQDIQLNFFHEYAEGRGEFQISEEEALTWFFDAETLAELKKTESVELAICVTINDPDKDFSELCAPLYERAEEVERTR